MRPLVLELHSHTDLVSNFLINLPNWRGGGRWQENDRLNAKTQELALANH